MFLYPNDIENKLEFDLIKSKLKGYCYGSIAATRCEKIRLYNQADRIENLLLEVQEMKIAKTNGDKVPLSPYSDIKEELYLLSKENYILEIESIVKLFDQISIISNIDAFFKIKRIQQAYPKISEIAFQIDLPNGLVGSFQKLFDKDKKIREDASPELASIFKKIKNKERQIQKLFDVLAKSFKQKGFLSDNVESFKSGRRVLSVNAESKRKIDGVIHDESTSGKTVFIEPTELVSLHNELYEFESEKRQEVYRILKSFCNYLSQFIGSFDLWQKIIARFDFINAKTNLAIAMNANMPKVQNEQMLQLKEAYHPYLLLVNQEVKKETVPFEINLDKENRVLIISGPNAGGKSVTMKAVGLIQMMLQSGMLVPVSSDSKVGVFHKILADIGDQQSIADDLSTYSSRLKNMQVFLKNANAKSLIFIDEFGSGTDPKIGGALAEAIISELHKKKTFGVVTTHYSNIKMFAHHTEGMVNGAMLFDQESLSPSYRLEVGRPGSSFAFEIAQKIGLNQQVLHLAKKKLGQNVKAVDELLVDLQNEKKELVDKLNVAEQEKKQLDTLIKRYELLHGDLEFKKKKFRMESKEKKLANVSTADFELNELIRELRKEKDLEKAVALKSKIKHEKQSLSQEITKLEEVVFYSENYKITDFKEGDFVKLKKGGNSAEIIKIKKNRIEIAVGFLRMKVGAEELVPAEKPIERKSRKSVTTQLTKNVYALESELDIRGYRMSEAILFINEFLDNAFLGQANVLKVIHGVGTGTLRKALLKRLKTYKGIKKVYQDIERYGEGLTFIEI